MPDPIEVLKALEVLVAQLGEDVDHYVNFAHLMESESLVSFVRPVFEERISRKYLPGFRFEDTRHAAWFLAKHASWPTWFSDYPIRPEHWDETWLRMILVPDKRHYIAEIAQALQKFDRNTSRVIKEYNQIRENGDPKQIAVAAQKLQIMRALRGVPPGEVKGERHLMAMESWPKRLLGLFEEFDLPKYDVSIIRLTKESVKYRSRRLAGTPANCWRISQVTYLGKIPNSQGADPQEWAAFTEGYLEVWHWHPTNGVEPPEQTKISFTEPAHPMLWQRKWKKNLKPFRP